MACLGRLYLSFQQVENLRLISLLLVDYSCGVQRPKQVVLSHTRCALAKRRERSTLDKVLAAISEQLMYNCRRGIPQWRRARRYHRSRTTWGSMSSTYHSSYPGRLHPIFRSLYITRCSSSDNVTIAVAQSDWVERQNVVTPANEIDTPTRRN